MDAAIASYSPKRYSNYIQVAQAVKSEDRLIATQDRNIYWLAGILEAEGSFLAGFPSRPNQPRIQVTTTDEDVVGWIASWLGVNYIVLKHRNDSHVSKKQAFFACVTAGPAVTIMRQLYALLGKRRQEQVRQALASYDLHKHKRNTAKLTDKEVLDIYRRAHSGELQRTIASEYGITRSTIADIKRGKSWRWLTQADLS